jgi:hypothetical protein
LTEPGLVAPLALAGLLLHWRRQPRFVALFVLTLLATVALVCCIWHVEWRFFSPLLPFFAISFADLVVRAVGAIGLGRWLSPALSLAAVSGVAVLVFRVYSSPAQQVIPQDRWGGCLAWVEQHMPIDSPILAFDPWSITWYTDRPSVLIPWGRSRAVVEVARRYRTDWLVVQAVGPRSQRRARRLISPGFGLSPELAYDGGECQVYRIDPAGD